MTISSQTCFSHVNIFIVFERKTTIFLIWLWTLFTDTSLSSMLGVWYGNKMSASYSCFIFKVKPRRLFPSFFLSSLSLSSSSFLESSTVRPSSFQLSFYLTSISEYFYRVLRLFDDHLVEWWWLEALLMTIVIKKSNFLGSSLKKLSRQWSSHFQTSISSCVIIWRFITSKHHQNIQHINTTHVESWEFSRG